MGTLVSQRVLTPFGAVGLLPTVNVLVHQQTSGKCPRQENLHCASISWIMAPTLPPLDKTTSEESEISVVKMNSFTIVMFVPLLLSGSLTTLPLWTLLPKPLWTKIGKSNS